MCNLGEGIEEKGIAKGEASLILKMYKNGLSAEQIASATDKEIEEVKAIIAEKIDADIEETASIMDSFIEALYGRWE